MVYALWDTETQNLVSEYATAHEALLLVLRGIERNGPDDTDLRALEVENECGDVVSIAHGRALAELARRELADTSPATVRAGGLHSSLPQLDDRKRFPSIESHNCAGFRCPTSPAFG